MTDRPTPGISLPGISGQDLLVDVDRLGTFRVVIGVWLARTIRSVNKFIFMVSGGSIHNSGLVSLRHVWLFQVTAKL